MTRGDQRERDRAKNQAKILAKQKGQGKVSTTATGSFIGISLGNLFLYMYDIRL